MSDALTLAEIDAQHVELLPARTVLSLFLATGSGGAKGGHAAPGGDGGLGRASGLSANLVNLNLFGDQTNSAGDAFGGAGGNTPAGDATYAHG
jgi:hypothetical protein